MSNTDSIREARETLNASDVHGIARVSVRCKPFPGVNKGVKALSYHPHSFPAGDGRSRADQFQRVRKGYAVRKALAALALTAAFAAPAVAAPAQSIGHLAPGGNIASVVMATEYHGWPHAPVRAETEDIAQIVLRTYTPIRARGSVFCRFGFSLGRVRCSLAVNRKQYAVTMRVFEDGSYRMGRSAK